VDLNIGLQQPLDPAWRKTLVLKRSCISLVSSIISSPEQMHGRQPQAEAFSEAEKLKCWRRSWIEEVTLSHCVLFAHHLGERGLSEPGAVRIIIERFV
jgi:hypothetical protein